MYVCMYVYIYKCDTILFVTQELIIIQHVFKQLQIIFMSVAARKRVLVSNCKTAQDSAISTMWSAYIKILYIIPPILQPTRVLCTVSKKLLTYLAKNSARVNYLGASHYVF